MAIPSRQIGWSTQANLLWQISKQLERLTCVTACGCGSTTTTTTTAIPTTTTTSSSSSTTSTTSSTTSTTSSTSSSTTTSTTTIEPTTTTTTTSNLTSIELQYFDGNMDGGDGTPCAPLREVGFLEYFTTIECVPLIVGCNLYTGPSGFPYFAANGYYQYGNGDYFYLFGGVVVNVNVCPQTQFFLRFDDGANLPVLDPYDVSDWNTFFNLPANGVPFYDVIVAGPSNNEITLIGGSGITLHNMLNRNKNLQEVTDLTKNVIFRTAPDCFKSDDILEIVKLPFAQFIANTTFSGCLMLREINLDGCLNLGDTVGDDLVFENIVGNGINLSVPVALMTCNIFGSPDGDIRYLVLYNTVTITTV